MGWVKRDDFEALWSRACNIDPMLHASSQQQQRLVKRQLRPVRFSYDRLFEAMARQRIALFRGHPLQRKLHQHFYRQGGPEQQLRALFSTRATTLVKLGPAQKRRHLRVHDVVTRWHSGRGVMSANDVFWRDLRFDTVFDCRSISDYNLLLQGSDAVRNLEVATLLMGSVGCMSDSHSDDPDGCNHCVFGTKLWLAWDREEGRRSGLQDCEYDEVYSRAHFDVSRFLKLKSAAWFTVSQGDTLFLPGSYTHKVMTLERYLGISSFYLTLANVLTTLTRWRLQRPRMVRQAHWQELATLAERWLFNTARAPRRTRHLQGFDHMLMASDSLAQRLTQTERNKLRDDPLLPRLAGLWGQMATYAPRARSPFA